MNLGRMAQPPTGVCAIPHCRQPAMKWIGQIDTLPDGRELRRGVGVCDLHANVTQPDSILSGYELGSPHGKTEEQGERPPDQPRLSPRSNSGGPDTPGGA